MIGDVLAGLLVGNAQPVWGTSDAAASDLELAQPNPDIVVEMGISLVKGRQRSRAALDQRMGILAQSTPRPVFRFRVEVSNQHHRCIEVVL